MSPPTMLIPACRKSAEKSKLYNKNEFIFKITLNLSEPLITNINSSSSRSSPYSDWLSIIFDK